MPQIWYVMNEYVITDVHSTLYSDFQSNEIGQKADLIRKLEEDVVRRDMEIAQLKQMSATSEKLLKNQQKSKSIDHHLASADDRPGSTNQKQRFSGMKVWFNHEFKKFSEWAWDHLLPLHMKWRNLCRNMTPLFVYSPPVKHRINRTKSHEQ